jgi:D-alanine-D-alanine ligase
VLGSAVGMDKDVMKRLLLQAGLPVLAYEAVRHGEWTRDRAGVLRRLEALGLPQFVKPANMGSSVGVGRVTQRAQLEPALQHAFEFDDKVVVERGLTAPREIECAVLGGELPRASIPGEISIDHADGFYSYNAKYIDESGAGLHIPAALTPEQTSGVQALALAVYHSLDTEGLARVDLFLTQDGTFYVNEINTMPGFTAISMFPQLWQASGVSAGALMDVLIEDALQRGARRRARRSTP